MTKRIARRDRQSPTITAALQVTAGEVSGRFQPTLPVSQVVLLLDGRPLATAKTVPDGPDGALGFSLALPAHVLGGSVDVVAAETGRSVLAAEVDLNPLRGLRWDGWAMRGRRVTGSFGFEGPAAPVAGLALPVEIRSGSALFGSCYALPGPGERPVYRFTTEVNRLPPPNEDIEITPRIGGIPVRARLTVTQAVFGYAGYVDSSDAPRAEGWAVDLANSRERVTLELRINGRAVAHAVADRMRLDVKELGLSDGRSGFVIPFPPGIPLDRDVQVEVVVAGSGLNLTNSPYTKPASPPFLGYFDNIDGPYIGGWIVDMHDPQTPVRVEALCNGEVVGSGVADLYRGDVENAGLPTARCGFQFLLDRPLPLLFGRDIALHVAGTDHVLAGSPRQIVQNPNITRFLARSRGVPLPSLRRLARRMTHQTRAIGISIIMPVFDPPRDWLVEAIASVKAQWSGNWELICVDDGSREPHVREVLDAYAAEDPRIRVLRAPDNMGIARAVNFGLRAARGNYVAFMDHDDTIEPDAVYRLAQAALETGADLIYSDEVLTGTDINSVIQVRARPAFSHDFYLSHPYFVHMVCVRTTIARELAGWDESLPISADVDFVLRAIERAGTVAHVPSVLYRWRTHERSAGHVKQAQVADATKAALGRHLARLGHAATVADGLGTNQYRIDWPDDGGEVLIVIPTKNRFDLLKTCIDSIEQTAPGANYRIVVIDHQSDDPRTLRYLAGLEGPHTVMPYAGAFNYARMNNLAVRTHGRSADYVLFLNNDVEAREPGWLPRLRSLAARAEVGAVGPLLLYDNDRVQHAGVLVGFSGAADHAMKLLGAYAGGGVREPGYNCNLTVVRDYSAVTAACLMMRRDVFAKVRGFDEKFAVGFNDTDLCLRIGEAGYKVLYDGHTVLYHHESATRAERKEVEHPEDDARLRTRWARYFERGDPFYSPLLAPRGTDHVLRKDDGCAGRMQARATELTLPDREAPPKREPRRQGRRRLARVD
ncbi:MAG: hypothetical protein NVSMB18_02040 [Acetobacteraceae bacterium]